ncbi:MAG: spore cortex biosynthesis protein YabQ [Clostridia bacterium]|nr:spore cortex biosynthesis protein YabQ [Clostridia bacterium]
MYDVLRAIRLSFTKSKIALIIFDVVYFILFGVLTFLFILALNKGEVRSYIIAGELMGAFFYYVSFGVAVIKFTDKAVSFLQRARSVLFKVITAPFRLLKRLFLFILKPLLKFLQKTEKKSVKMRKKLLPKLRLYVYNLFGILFAHKSSLKKGGGSFGKNKEE